MLYLAWEITGDHEEESRVLKDSRQSGQFRYRNVYLTGASHTHTYLQLFSFPHTQENTQEKRTSHNQHNKNKSPQRRKTDRQTNILHHTTTVARQSHITLGVPLSPSHTTRKRRELIKSHYLVHKPHNVVDESQAFVHDQHERAEDPAERFWEFRLWFSEQSLNEASLRGRAIPSCF